MKVLSNETDTNEIIKAVVGERNRLAGWLSDVCLAHAALKLRAYATS